MHLVVFAACDIRACIVLIRARDESWERQAQRHKNCARHKTPGPVRHIWRFSALAVLSMVKQLSPSAFVLQLDRSPID